MSAIIGELKNTRREMHVEWNIPDFLSLSMAVGEFVESPRFKFLEKDWHLSIYPNGENKTVVPGSVGVFINKFNDGIPSPLVEWSLALKSAEGEKFHETCQSGIFDVYWGYDDLFSKSDLQDSKKSFLPGGVLTVVCSLKNRSDPCSVPCKVPSSVSRMDKLSEDFEAMLTVGVDADVTVTVEEEEFKLHKNVLNSRSPYFAAMFRHEMSEKSSGTVKISDCKADTFRILVRYLYTGRAELTTDSVFHLFKLADMYQEEELKVDCLKYVKDNLTVDTFCRTVTLALAHDYEDLLKHTTEFLAFSMEDIMATDEWVKFLGKNLFRANKMLLEAIKLKKSYEDESGE